MVQAEDVKPSAGFRPPEAAPVKPISPRTQGSSPMVSPSPQPEHESCSCGSVGGKCTCGVSDKIPQSRSYIYAMGTVEARFPSPSVEKEYAQATTRADATGLTDREVVHSILSQRHNRYLARQMCWVFTIEGLETYILQPRDPADFDLLVESLRPGSLQRDIDVVIGMRGPNAPAEMCNGLMIPIVMFDQIYSFDIDTLIKSIPKPESVNQNRFKQAAEELFWRVIQITDNTGVTDEHRALNYLAVRYHTIYAKTAEAFAENSSLTSVEVRPSRLGGVRKIVDVIFSFTNRQTDVTDKQFVRVDVTEEFPFLVTKLSPYYER